MPTNKTICWLDKISTPIGINILILIYVYICMYVYSVCSKFTVANNIMIDLYILIPSIARCSTK